MESFCYVIIIFSLLSCASSPLSYASPTIFSRRLLQQALPGEPPFFPSYNTTTTTSSSSPPPSPVSLPPPAPTDVTFPANISALVLPRSPKPQTSSRTLLVPVIAAVLAVAVAISLSVFLYTRWRGENRHFKNEQKSSDSDITQTQTPSEQQTQCSLARNTNTTQTNKLTVSASTSDVLYLGNVATTTNIGFVKPESPEISPLPLLPSRSFPQQSSETEQHDDEEDDDDDFYSPLASLAGQETGRRRNNNYYSHSSSSSDSPTMSPSIAAASPSPERRVRRSYNKRHGGASLRMFSLWNQNLGFPRISSASTSPERGGGALRTPDAYARSSMYSSVSTTPDRFFLRKVLESSPPRWNEFSRNVKSLFLSSTSASPARDFVMNISESSRELKSSWDNNVEVDISEVAESAPPPPPPQPQRPPPLVPPSQSFMVQKSGKKLSFSELPQSCWEGERVKGKLRPLPWDRVTRKNTWDSLKFNSLDAKLKQRSLSCDLPVLNQECRVLESRKCQSIALFLTTLKLTTNDVCQALRDGHYEALGVELLESLLRIAPSEEEERKLMRFNDDESVSKLAPSERFLKDLLNVPFVFKRIDALLSVASFGSNVQHVKRSFGVVLAACEELRNSKMLLKFLEVVMERGTKLGNARDFKLEALLEIVDIKGLDGRTTLLQSVVQNIIESEGNKGLQVVRSLGSVLIDVKRSADMDYSVLRNEVLKLYQGVQKVSEVLLLSEEKESNEEQQWWKFGESMTRFLQTAAEEMEMIERTEGCMLSAVKEITVKFHGDSAKEEAQLLHVFVILRDFSSILDKVCKQMEVSRV